MKSALKIILVLLLLAALPPVATLAQEEVVCESDVVVQADDWLSKIADKVYGNVLAFPAIAEATNSKAAADDSYSAIDDVNVIEPGWKLCLPPAAAVEQAVGESAAMAAVPAMADRPDIPVVRLAGGNWGYPSPFSYIRGPGYVHSSFIFDTLVWKDADGNFMPWLATDWTMSNDGLQWTFILRDGVQWTDGQPLTAEDVVFSYQYQSQNPTGLPIQALTEVKEVTSVGNSVTFSLDKPYSPFLPLLAGQMPIIPKHIWESVADPKALRGPEAVTGSGPYKLAEYNQEDGSYLYEANENFFLGVPAVKRLEFLPTGNEVLSVAQGDLDAGGPGVQSAPTDDVLAQFQADPFATLTGPGEWHLILRFNMTKEPFNDKRFRQAVAYAVNRQDMVDRLLLGRGLPGNPGWLSPASQWYNPNVPSYNYDPAHANALLDEMGLMDTNGDGIRELPDGTPLSYNLRYATDAVSPRNIELLQSYLKPVGIELTPQGSDRATNDQAAVSGDYDAILVGHGGLGGDPDFMRTTFHSQSKSQSFARPHGYVNEEFDQIAIAQLRQLDDAKRVPLVNRMQEIIAEDLPVLSLYHPDRYWFYNKNVMTGWHYKLGGIAGGIPLTLDKALFVEGKAP